MDWLLVDDCVSNGGCLLGTSKVTKTETMSALAVRVSRLVISVVCQVYMRLSTSLPPSPVHQLLCNIQTNSCALSHGTWAPTKTHVCQKCEKCGSCQFCSFSRMKLKTLSSIEKRTWFTGRGIAAGNFGGGWVCSMVFYAPRPSSCSNTVSNECSKAEFLLSRDAEMSRLCSSGLTWQDSLWRFWSTEVDIRSHLATRSADVLECLCLCV
jgi:hypothetical protein